MGQTAVSDNQSSSVTLNELAKKARQNILEFRISAKKSYTMTEINLNRAQTAYYIINCLEYMNLNR